MKKFSLHFSTYVNTKLPIYDLHLDGECVFDEFYEKIQREGNLKKQLSSAISILESVAKRHSTS